MALLMSKQATAVGPPCSSSSSLAIIRSSGCICPTPSASVGNAAAAVAAAAAAPEEDKRNECLACRRAVREQLSRGRDACHAPVRAVSWRFQELAHPVARVQVTPHQAVPSKANSLERRAVILSTVAFRKFDMTSLRTLLQNNMRGARFDDEQGRQKKYDTWKPSSTRLGRLRRPLLLVLCAVALIVLWHCGITGHEQSPRETAFLSQRVNAALKLPGPDRTRSGFEDDAQHNLEFEDRALAKPFKRRRGDVSTPGDKDSLHGIQFEQQQHLERPNSEHDSAIEHGQVEHAELYVEDHPRAIAEEEQNPDHDSDTQEGEEITEKKAETPIEKADSIFSPPDLDVSSISNLVEKEPDEHLALEEKGESLPEILFIPFEDVVNDMELEGWEDDWVADAAFDAQKWHRLKEPRIDFVYLWVNGSEEAFQETIRPFELNSVLNDPDGVWIKSHGTNRYRDWDELRYSVRSVETHASSFRNKVQILVNSVQGTDAKKQIPTWLNDEPLTKDIVQVLAQEEFFDSEKRICLPTFNSLTIENQIFNTPSDVDHFFAMSDDMLLGRPHAASDIYSPLFGPVLGFKTNLYNTVNPPTKSDAERFGEKPFLIYTSWLLNRRFGIRKRAGQGHFGHSLSRSVTREAIGSFPGPELQSACKRFRGEPGFQLYSWYATFHYLIERHREALLWSYIMLRSDIDDDGNLSWAERQIIMKELEAGMKNEGRLTFRKRNFYHVAQLLQRAGLAAPKVNTDIQWTSLDGPAAIRGIDCTEFDVNECLAPGFSSPMSDQRTKNTVFSSATVFDRIARQNPKCGDCLLKLILNQRTRGLSPLLPSAKTQPEKRDIVVKAVMRYQYTIIQPDALFVMVTDAEQVDSTLVSRFVRQKKPMNGQLCLNDDVSTENEQELQDVMQAMRELYQGLFPEKSPFEK